MYKSGLGVPKIKERKEAWMHTITRHCLKIEELETSVPEMKEIKEVKGEEWDEIIVTPL